MFNLRKQKGFTLIELLIVVAIIGILAALLIPNAMTALQRAKVRGTQQDISQISSWIAEYITDKATPFAQTGDITAAMNTALVPMYTKVLPTKDQWGTGFKVYTGTAVSVYGITGAVTDDFLVASWGRGGVVEGFTYNASAPEAGYYSISTTADFDKDLINFNGQFIRCPRSGTAGT
jgi:prepilin-type N-terminal cleavage/methylation domain-containing protein